MRGEAPPKESKGAKWLLSPKFKSESRNIMFRARCILLLDECRLKHLSPQYTRPRASRHLRTAGSLRQFEQGSKSDELMLSSWS
mmetsp:Transcript_39389/g.72679  ORF Transcript_39389/g.72679 Transcript_39389/m.72679 type:complete len:84 (-) Transcript_39389:2324-2575(-)